MRFFKVQPDHYEARRLALDVLARMPQGETVYEPLATAPRHPDGDALIGVRAAHCAVEPWQSELASSLASGNAVEITRAEYEAAIPQPEGMQP